MEEREREEKSLMINIFFFFLINNEQRNDIFIFKNGVMFIKEMKILYQERYSNNVGIDGEDLTVFVKFYRTISSKNRDVIKVNRDGAVSCFFYQLKLATL